MTRKEKIEAIYKEIADKTLNFGCRVKCCGLGYFIENEYDVIDEDGVMYYLGNKIQEIIGHPVMIGDVLDWYNIKCNVGFGLSILSLRKKLRLPINKQSDECIDYIYNLIQK